MRLVWQLVTLGRGSQKPLRDLSVMRQKIYRYRHTFSIFPVLLIDSVGF